MKALKIRVHPVTVILVLAIVGLAIFMGYSHKLERPPVATVPAAEQRQLPAFRDEELGAWLRPSLQQDVGDTVLGFQPSAAASPLAQLGCVPGDVLVSCNGKPIAGNNVAKAIEAMEKTGKPVVLVVFRDGKKTELKTTKMPDIPPVLQRIGRKPAGSEAPKGGEPGR